MWYDVIHRNRQVHSSDCKSFQLILILGLSVNGLQSVKLTLENVFNGYELLFI